jgi:hypothetical protein
MGDQMRVETLLKEIPRMASVFMNMCVARSRASTSPSLPAAISRWSAFQGCSRGRRFRSRLCQEAGSWRPPRCDPDQSLASAPADLGSTAGQARSDRGASSGTPPTSTAAPARNPIAIGFTSQDPVRRYWHHQRSTGLANRCATTLSVGTRSRSPASPAEGRKPTRS